jgi:hypothetical protein
MQGVEYFHFMIDNRLNSKKIKNFTLTNFESLNI